MHGGHVALNVLLESGVTLLMPREEHSKCRNRHGAGGERFILMCLGDIWIRWENSLHGKRYCFTPCLSACFFFMKNCLVFGSRFHSFFGTRM